MKFIEKEHCHFAKTPCPHPIPKEELEDIMENSDAGVIYNIPVEDSQICFSCLLAQIVECLKSIQKELSE